MNNAISKDDTTPIVVVIPGLTSDSAAAVSTNFVNFFVILLQNFMMSVGFFWKLKVHFIANLFGMGIKFT